SAAGAGSTPRASQTDPTPLHDTSTLVAAVTALNEFFPGAHMSSRTIDELREWAGALAADAVTPFRVARIRQIKGELRTLGAGEFVDDICGANPSEGTWKTRFDVAWLKSCLDAAFADEPGLATFSGQSHQAVVEEFKRLDVERLELAIARVLRSHAERVIAV